MKIHLLDYGNIEADLGWVIQGAGSSIRSDTNPDAQRRLNSMSGALIEHPKAGLILYETGPAPDAQESWPEPVSEAFHIRRYDEANRVDVAVNAAGFDIADIKAIIISHLHLDHAGGLEFFRGMDVPIFVHEEELKHAFYAVATKEDYGAYLPHYLDPSFNWHAISEDRIEFFEGLTLYRTQGHTPGLLMLQADLRNAGTFLFTSDLMPLRDNFETPVPQGWLGRDHYEWWRGYKFAKHIADRTDARLVFGHDYSVLHALIDEAKVFD